MDRKDVVGMARTGSGKTAAFVIPMIERLRAHSARVGARAVIMSPSRELALQTLKVVKEFGKGTDLKTVLLVGGDSLEDQFGLMTTNPDIVIATPGRFLHIAVEMRMDLSSVRYVVFDEADRLFEMGFAAQLAEILHKLPASRQTLLFSATLPQSLFEFARAGLQDPSLVRLDADSKISPDLESAFFAVKGEEKEGALLYILHDVIKMPTGLPEGAQEEASKPSKKRKRGSDGPGSKGKPTEHSTIVFTATKHHVEYLAALLRHAGFAVSYVYGSLDQTARKMHIDQFRRGATNVLVVTDLAARGIDIPVLANVINFDFPSQPKVFVHRVGRTARAGQRGWSYSLVRDTDVPYLLDLQLFLGRRFVVGQEDKGAGNFAQDVVVGTLPRAQVESHVEWLTKVLGDIADISALQSVVGKAEKQYFKGRSSASSQSARRAREVVASRGWVQLHPLFGEEAGDMEQARSTMLAKISGFKPQESVFEIGVQGRKGVRNAAAEVMKVMREKIGPRKKAKQDRDAEDDGGPDDITAGPRPLDDGEDESMVDEDAASFDLGSESDSEVEVTVSNSTDRKDKSDWRDSEVFMSYTPRTTNAREERGYGVHSGADTSTFVEAARAATMDLTNDETAKKFGVPMRSKLRWDKKQSKYVARANDEDGTKGAKMIRGESGVKIAASFQSGRFDKWRRAQRLGRLPRVGDEEKPGQAIARPGQPGSGGFRYKHNKQQAPKEADKFRDDYHVRKKRVAEAKEKRIGRFQDGEGSRREIKTADDIRKARKTKEMRRAKNARPSKNGKR